MNFNALCRLMGDSEFSKCKSSQLLEYFSKSTMCSNMPIQYKSKILLTSIQYDLANKGTAQKSSKQMSDKF